MKYLPGKSLREIAFSKQLRVNGTRKQRDALELKDFRIFIEEFVSLSFKKKHKIYKKYVDLMIKRFNQVRILTVKDLLKNILNLNNYKEMKEFKFTPHEI